MGHIEVQVRILTFLEVPTEVDTGMYEYDQWIMSEELKGEELFEAVTGAALLRKEQQCINRCRLCWHDRLQRCICVHAKPRSLHLSVNVKVLVLMHSKEYLNPGDDAKLLLAMLQHDRATLYVRSR